MNEQNVTFLGRLATYRYLDMHVIIAEALETAAHFIAWRNGAEARPVFGGEAPVESEDTPDDVLVVSPAE